MKDNLLSIWKNIDSDSFYIEEMGEKFFKNDIKNLIDKAKSNLLSIADFSNRKVFIDIKDRKTFVILFLALLELEAKPILVPPEVKIDDYFYSNGIFISDNKNYNGVVKVEKDFSIKPDIDFIAEEIEAPIKDKNIVIYLYTSGSTGKPKLISKNSKNLLSEIDELSNILKVKKDSVFYFTTPLYHVYGFLNSFLLPFYSSSKIVIDQKFTPEDITEFVNKKNITHFVSIPSYYRIFSEMKLINKFSKCENLVSSSAPLPLEVSKEFYEHGSKITEIYGSTETGGIAHRVSAENLEWTLYSYVKIIEEWNDYLNPVNIKDEEKITELRIISPAISVEYDIDTGFNTGDVVNLSKDGTFKLLGRNTRFVKIAGKRVDLQHVLEKIKNYLNKYYNNSIKEEQLYVGEKNQKIYLIYEERFPKNIKEIREDLKELLPSYSIPRLFLNSKIPRNNMGKINKAEIDKIIKEKLK